MTTQPLIEFNFQGTQGLSLVGRCWPPSQKPRAVVAFVHGVGDHSGRYSAVVDGFTAAGFAVCAFDLRGHGTSQGQRGHIDRWSQYRGDVMAYLEQVRSRYPDFPLFIYGHSLGALIVTEYVLSHPAGLDGMVLSGIPLRPTGVANKPLVLLARSLSRIWPTFSISLGVDGTRLSRDPSAVMAYDEDPLAHHTATARWGTEALDAIDRVKSRMSEIGLPVLILHGDADQVNSVEGSKELFAAVSSEDKELRTYPGGRHEPHNDIVRDQVVNDVVVWLDRQLDKKEA